MTFDALPALSGYTPSYGGTYPGFPAGPLDILFELGLSGTWTDITRYVYQRDQVNIGRGHPDESTTTATSTLACTLNNKDGRFSSLNPTGPYYGSLGRNTPVRVSFPEGASYLRLENDGSSAASAYVSCSDSAGVSITGDTDIQLDVTLDNWNAGTILAAKWAETANQRTWLLLLNDIGSLTLVVSGDGSNAVNAFSKVPLTLPPLLRQCIRVTWASASSTATFYTAPAGNLDTASWTQIDQVVTSGTVTTLFDSTAPPQLGWCTDAAFQTNSTAGVTGKIHAMRLLSGIAGTAKASPDFTAQTAGATSFNDAQSNTWTLHRTAEISNRKYRFHGEVAAWPQAWNTAGTDVYIQISASGLLRRLGRNTQPVLSAMRRAITSLPGSIAPVAYWPCEDAADATQFGSGLSSGLPMAISQGSPPAAVSSDSTFAGSAPLPQVQSSTWNGVVPAASWTDNVVRFLYYAPAGITHNGTIASYQTTGTVAQVALVYDNSSNGNLKLVGFDASGGTVFDSGFPGGNGFAVDGQICRISMNLKFNGAGSIGWEIETYKVGDTAAGTFSGTVSGTIGAVKAVKINPGSKAQTSQVIGHVSVQAVWDSMFDVENNKAVDGTYTGPLRGWAGEPAGNRFGRLCTENGVAFRGRGRLGGTVPMGVQGQQTLTSLLQECADADRGQWTEPRQCLGWGYRASSTLGNQTAAVTLSYVAATISGLTPTEDDQTTLNDVTAVNAGGSSARQVLATGALSVQPPPSGIGVYDTSVPLNLFSDTQLADEAGWILHTGTVNEPRYPALSVNMARTQISSVYYDLQDMDVGDRLVVTSPPVWLPPGQVDQLVQGLSEAAAFRTFSETWALVPASPWNAGIADDAVYGHADTDGSTLHADITSGATSMTVDTTNAASPLWTTAAGDFPFDIQLGGERITVTNITGSSSPQTFTITRSVNGVVKAHTAGDDVRLFTPMILALT